MLNRTLIFMYITLLQHVIHQFLCLLLQSCRFTLQERRKIRIKFLCSILNDILCFRCLILHSIRKILSCFFSFFKSILCKIFQILCSIRSFFFHSLHTGSGITDRTFFNFVIHIHFIQVILILKKSLIKINDLFFLILFQLVGNQCRSSGNYRQCRYYLFHSITTFLFLLYHKTCEMIHEIA